MTSYLLSLLARQRILLQDRFDARYPHAWLVWEPGNRIRPSSPAELDAGSTQLPQPFRERKPAGSDAVCFPLVPSDRPITMGRAAGNHIVIDDMSFSREHAMLTCAADVWHIEACEASTIATFVRRMSLQPGEPVRLFNECSISAGGVDLTFYGKGQLTPRLDQLR